MTALTDSGLRRLLEEALAYLKTHLNAERLLFLHGWDGQGFPTKAGLGMDPGDLSGVSLSLFERVMRSGTPLLSADAQADPGLGDANSLLLSGIRSVLCVPLRQDGRVVGLLYADHRGRTGCFSHTDLIRVTGFARDLERRMAGATLPPWGTVEAPPAPPRTLRKKPAPQA
ncbi:MAG: GAF domain-containing protein, partial [Candidatus Eremiobacterota bacterium]